jgi:hypothetical protein
MTIRSISQILIHKEQKTSIFVLQQKNNNASIKIQSPPR